MYELHFCNFIPIIILLYIPLVSSVNSKVDVSGDYHEENLKTIEFGNNCDETITESRFLLQTPKYPEAYPPDLNCKLNIKGEDCPTYYSLKFIDFNLENSPGCVKDRLEVGLVDALCGKKNGTKEYLANNGTLTLHFKTDDTFSAGGYKILVTRIEECANKPPSSSKTFTTSGVEKHSYSNLSECCQTNSKSSRHFTINSPNFPASMSYPYDCVLQIHKASSDVCRLRIIFRFFWFGNSLECSEGYLQIDGKIICGCKKDLKLISKFDENLKVLRFRSTGLLRNSYSGFQAEIFQDDCPKKIRTNITIPHISTDVELPNNKQELKIFTPFRKEQTNYVSSIYPEEILPQEKEMNDFLDTEDISGILGNEVNIFDSCLRWNQAQFDQIFNGKEIKLSECRSSRERNYEERNCKRFIDQSGHFFNPGYPFFYPGNLEICYRFEKFPRSCGVRMKFFDFRITRSEFCARDRLAIEGRPYCGLDLWNKIVTLDFRNKDFVELDFITSAAKCAQGFSAYYEYFPCEEIPTESPIPPPITKILPVPPPATDRPKLQCGGVVRAKIFTLTNDERSPECIFIVEKSTEDICQLILKFEQFPIDCKSEVLRINGKPYCGNRIRNEVIVDAEEFPVEIVYKDFEYTQSSSGFRIKGFQDTTSCRLPPAQLSR